MCQSFSILNIKIMFVSKNTRGGVPGNGGKSMKVAVLIKQVPDTDEVKMDPETGTMIREGVDRTVNPLDLHALEAALCLAKKGGSVTVFSMGPPQAEEALRECLSLGADDAVLLSDRAFAGADSWATAVTIAAALRLSGPFDLILAGDKATDGETGQVGPEVAAILEIPFATHVIDIACQDDQHLVVSRNLDEGIQKQRFPLPCLLSVLSDLNEIQLPTLEGFRNAWRKPIRTFSREALGLPREAVGLTGSPTRVVRIDHPRFTRKTEKYAGTEIARGLDRVIEILREAALL